MNTVIFDMDGLLINSEPLWREGMAKVFTKLGAQLEPEDYKKTMGLRTSEVVAFWCDYFKWEDVDPENLEKEILDEVIALVVEKGKLMEGVDYILEFFKRKNFKIGLASSSPMRMIQKVLSHFKISSYFMACHSGQFQDYGKPHPSVYLSCAKELKTSPSECLVFEDSLNGLIAAKAARMTTVVIPELSDRADIRFSLGDLKLNSLLEFTEEKLQFLEKEMV